MGDNLTLIARPLKGENVKSEAGAVNGAERHIHHELLTIRNRIRYNVKSWSQTSLLVTDIAEHASEEGVKDILSEFGTLVGYFPVLDADMRATGSATVTYARQLDAQKAFERLSSHSEVFRVKHIHTSREDVSGSIETV